MTRRVLRVNLTGTLKTVRLPAAPAGVGVATPNGVALGTLGSAIVSRGALSTDWNFFQNREHGNAVYDPGANHASRAWLLPVSGVNFNGGDVRLGIYHSADGVTWTNQLTNGTVTGVANDNTARGEDGYFCKDISTGNAYRDASNRLLVYCEEKPGAGGGQRGIELWRSTDALTWTKFGRVIDMGGGTTAWDASDRTSPVVFHDGTSFTMLFEGRNLNVGANENLGEIGVATSTDGLNWTVAASPIITRAATTNWGKGGIVCDDIIKVGSTYYLTAHGQAAGAGGATAFNNMGRWVTTVAPASWVAGSFTELPGNPYDTLASTHCFVGNDPTKVVTERDRFTLHLQTVTAT